MSSKDFQQQKKSLLGLIYSYEEKNLKIALQICINNIDLRTAVHKEFEQVEPGKKLNGFLGSKIYEKVKTGLLILDILCKDQQSLTSFFPFSSECTSIRALSKNMPKVTYKNEILIWLIGKHAEFKACWTQKLKKFNFSRRKIFVIPESIGNFKNLISLNISSNNITKLPVSIGQLTKLKKLNLAYNKITELPDFFSELSRLTDLEMNSNRLKKLPESIGQLKNLSRLFLSHNELIKIPSCIGNLHQLQFFYLDSNKLTDLPVELSNLSKLDQLRLSNNKISKISFSFSQMQNLYSVDLSENLLTVFPSSVCNAGIKQ
jgi:hypothetical protein